MNAVLPSITAICQLFFLIASNYKYFYFARPFLTKEGKHHVKKLGRKFLIFLVLIIFLVLFRMHAHHCKLLF
uniref:Uncharacterized protein n=1 Tax=Arundo donax TaxID=35708 RepID=A0A0A9AGN2_ARUDO